MQTTTPAFPRWCCLSGSARRCSALAFRGLQGERLIESLFELLPGGINADIWFLMALIFVLGFFLERIEISYIAVPLFLPIFNAAGRRPGMAGYADHGQPADVVPDAAIRLGAVLPAGRCAARNHDAPTFIWA